MPKAKTLAKQEKNDDRISPWWILAGIFEIGLLVAPSRISHTSSKHKGWRFVFVLLFIIAIIGNLSADSATYSGGEIYGLLVAMQGVILLMMYFSTKYDDLPFSRISLFILIGIVLGFVGGLTILFLVG